MLRCKQTNLRQLYRLELWVTAAFGPGPGTHWHQNNCSLSLFQQKQIHLTEREEQRRPTTLTVTERQSSNIRPWAPPGPSSRTVPQSGGQMSPGLCYQEMFRCWNYNYTHTHGLCQCVVGSLSRSVKDFRMLLPRTNTLPAAEDTTHHTHTPTPPLSVSRWHTDTVEENKSHFCLALFNVNDQIWPAGCQVIVNHLLTCSDIKSTLMLDLHLSYSYRGQYHHGGSTVNFFKEMSLIQNRLHKNQICGKYQADAEDSESKRIDCSETGLSPSLGPVSLIHMRRVSL